MTCLQKNGVTHTPETTQSLKYLEQQGLGRRSSYHGFHSSPSLTDGSRIVDLCGRGMIGRCILTKCLRDQIGGGGGRLRKKDLNTVIFFLIILIGCFARRKFASVLVRKSFYESKKRGDEMNKQKRMLITESSVITSSCTSYQTAAKMLPKVPSDSLYCSNVANFMAKKSSGGLR